MENVVFINSAKEIIEKVVNNLAAKDYAKLTEVISLDNSWVEPGMTMEEASISFGEWLDESLRMWSEDYGKDIVIDKFDESSLEELEVIKDRIVVSYDPTSNGERLDIWFEFKFVLDNDEVKGIFNIGV